MSIGYASDVFPSRGAPRFDAKTASEGVGFGQRLHELEPLATDKAACRRCGSIIRSSGVKPSLTMILRLAEVGMPRLRSGRSL
jgi:hypothetical protein